MPLRTDLVDHLLVELLIAALPALAPDARLQLCRVAGRQLHDAKRDHRYEKQRR